MMLVMHIAKRALLGLSSRNLTPKYPVVARQYHENVIYHYENPPNVGPFDKNDPNVGTGFVGGPACGDVMKPQIRVDDDSSKISDARFRTLIKPQIGPGSAISSSSLATNGSKEKR